MDSRTIRQPRHRRQLRGFSLIEIAVVMTVVGLSLAVFLHYQSKANDERIMQEIVKQLNDLRAAVQRNLAAERSYQDLTNARFYQWKILRPPMKYSADTQSAYTPWDEQIVLGGNPAGVAPRFAILYYARSTDRCMYIANALAAPADRVHVGTGVTISNGNASGGLQYKDAAGVISNDNLSAGCSVAGYKYVAFQYH